MYRRSIHNTPPLARLITVLLLTHISQKYLPKGLYPIYGKKAREFVKKEEIVFKYA